MVQKNQVDDEKMYLLKVTRAVPYGVSGRNFLTPATENVVKGKVISTIPDDAIETIEDVETPPA